MPPPDPRSSTVSPGFELGEGRRVAAAQRRGDRIGRHLAALGVGVEVRGDRVVAPARGGAQQPAVVAAVDSVKAAAIAPYFCCNSLLDRLTYDLLYMR